MNISMKKQQSIGKLNGMKQKNISNAHQTCALDHFPNRKQPPWFAIFFVGVLEACVLLAAAARRAGESE